MKSAAITINTDRRTMRNMDSSSGSSSGECSPDPFQPGASTRPPRPQGPATTRRRPIPRKGHTKSRRGCFNCKKRKVKCTEGLPECDHCQRLGLICEYPPPRRYFGATSSDDALTSPDSPAGYGAMAMAVALAAAPPAPRPLQMAPMAFSRDDLRFFSHFLLTAYPPLPLGGDAIWKQVATISYEFDFLIHAMLGLAASHLSLMAPAGYENQAISHRVTAIRLLNQALSTPAASSADADARFAAMLVLTFQAAYMPEGGMMEFVSLVRGCNVVARIPKPHKGTIFSAWTEDDHLDTVRNMNVPSPGAMPQDSPQDQETLDNFMASLALLAPDCRGRFEITWLTCIEKVLTYARTSSLQGFYETARAYQLFGACPHEEFEAFTSPDNYVAQLLMVHFFLVEYHLGRTVLGPVLSSFLVREKVNAAWVLDVGRRLPPEYSQKFGWIQSFYCDSVISQSLPSYPTGFARPEDTGREMTLRLKGPNQGQ